MILKKRIRKEETQIRCFNIIIKDRDKKAGEKCNARLLDKNSLGEVAGRIKCPRCNALFEIANNYIYLIRVDDKKGGKH